MVETFRQEEILCLDNGKTRQGGVALNGRRVVARGSEVIAGAFRELLESLSKDDLHAKPLSDFVRDPPVSRPRHALVDLLEAEDIGAPNRFTLQAPLELGPSLAFFDIPRDQANGLIPHGP